MFKKIIKGLKDVWCGSLEFDTTPKAGSYNPVTSDGVYKAIQSSVIPANVDVIKWSDVEDMSDYIGLNERIAADIAAGIEPVVLDDTSKNVIAVLRLTVIDAISGNKGFIFTTATTGSYGVSLDYNTFNGSVTTNYINGSLQKGHYSIDTENNLVYVNNNASIDYTYTGSNPLDFVVKPNESMNHSASFAVKITSSAQTDGTVTVCKDVGGIFIPLMPSVAGGTTVEAGKTYQLTCVGDCWTLAEFEEPSDGLKTNIGGKLYNVVKIGNLYWMAENLAYNFNGLTSPATDDSETDPVANYYNGDSSTYGSNGLLYNGAAALYLQEHRTELGLGGWRVPTTDDFNALFTAVGGASTAATKLKSTSGWDSGYEGTDDYGFSALGAGGFTALYTQPVSGFNYINVGQSACFATCTEDDGNVYQCTLWQDSGEPQMSYPAPKYVGCNIRLVMDA